MPANQYVAADRREVVLVPHSLVLRKREVFFGCRAVVRLVMNRPREADFRKNECRQFPAERFECLNQFRTRFARRGWPETTPQRWLEEVATDSAAIRLQ